MRFGDDPRTTGGPGRGSTHGWSLSLRGDHQKTSGGPGAPSRGRTRVSTVSPGVDLSPTWVADVVAEGVDRGSGGPRRLPVSFFLRGVGVSRNPPVEPKCLLRVCQGKQGLHSSFDRQDRAMCRPHKGDVLSRLRRRPPWSGT